MLSNDNSIRFSKTYSQIKLSKDRRRSYEETLYLFINDIKNLQSTIYNKLRINRKMIPLTDEQRDLSSKVINCDWCKKEFNKEYYCNKCYAKVNAEKNHEKKCPIETDEDKQSLNDEENQVPNTFKKCTKYKNDIHSCYNRKRVHSMTPPSEQLKEISQVALNDPTLRTA